jgi:DNA-directed RNA polymerase specialized sigma24 family protein
MIEPQRTALDREQLFAQRYEWLLGLALQLTGGDQERAEDLLHNAFIQFTLPRHDLPPVQNLDGYLYAMLRNVHVSQERQAAVLQRLTVSIAEYDSAEIMLRTADAQALLRARDDLRAICRYACLRMETSKVGSILILRFFHDYFPSEVALIARCARNDVDRFLWQARREARSYLENPGSLHFIAERPQPLAPSRIEHLRPQLDLVAELRAEIFRSRRGDCLPAKAIRATYKKGQNWQVGQTKPGGAIEAPLLAHFAACERCLNLICEALGLTQLSQRRADDDSGPGTQSGAGKGAGRGPSAESFIKRSRRRAQETAEHRPKELRILANGFFLGAQSVNAEVNEQVLKVNIEEPLAFIEVLSEQGLRLLVQPVETPPAGAIEQRAVVDLSDGRTLEVTASFRSARPTLRVVYRDPSDCGLRIADCGLEEDLASPDHALPSASEKHPADEPQSFSWLQSAIRNPQSAIRRWLRPLPLTILLSVTLVAALFYLSLRTKPPVAEELLRLAQQAEAIAAPSGQAAHRVIQLEERRPSDQKVIARRRIEVWQRAGKSHEVTRAERVYDESDTLIAGAWRKADGAGAIKRRAAKSAAGEPSSAAPRREPGHPPRDINEAALLSLSAQTFNKLTAGGDIAVEERPAAYLLSYRKQTVQSTTPLLAQARLTLQRPQLRVIEETLLVNYDGEEREWRFSEISYEARPISAFIQRIFEPDAELDATDANDIGTRRQGEATTITPSPSIPFTPSPNLAALEVEALSLLAQGGDHVGEQVSVTRATDGRLSIEGLVEADARKAEILRLLAQLKQNPAVRIEIKTMAEALRETKPRPPGAVTVREYTATENEFLAAAELRLYFAGEGGQAEERVRQYARHMAEHANQTMLHAAELRRLTKRFTVDELRALDTAGRARWLALIRERARSLAGQLDRLGDELRPIFFTSASGVETSQEVAGDEALLRASEQLYGQCATVDRYLRAAFTVPTGTAPENLTISSPQFWRALTSAEALAARIAAINDQQ